MDFDCEQRNAVHFFYTLPYTKNKALIETTWLSAMNDDFEKDYEKQIKDYAENHLKLKEYKINYKEEGAIPLFYPSNKHENNKWCDIYEKMLVRQKGSLRQSVADTQ